MTRPGTDGERSSVGRLAALPLVGLVKAYQLCVSPWLPPSCRFYPSCSAYAVTALMRFGPVTGSWLAFRRLLRCHPWNPGGVDHVPPRGPDGRPMRHNERRREDVVGDDGPSSSVSPPGATH